MPSEHLNAYIHECETGINQLESPLQVLYRILTVMYDKTLHSLHIAGQDVFRLQESMIYHKKSETDYLESLMTQKINMIAVMHNFKPHKDILADLSMILKDKTPKLKVYRADLGSKLKKMISTTSVLFDTTDALINTYNALLNMNTNNLITRLTIFTAIIGACNLIVGTYGMNIPLPGQ
jgi:Mg2+ and Co2+ transporter CorA